jgi:hypothetical protein
MYRTKIGLGVLALVLGVTAVSAETVFAYRGDPDVQGPNYSSERHDAMIKVFENKDYSEWLNLMRGRERVVNIINEDNFDKFVEAHELSLQGKTEEAREIRESLGLGLQNGSGRQDGSRMREKGRGLGRNLNR